MIPRVLHYGCFGGYQLSPLNLRCLESWKRVLPDYEIRRWDDTNLPDIPWVRRAAKECPINCHNFMMLYTIWNYGGVAMDCDVEVIRPFDLNHGMIVGFQKDHEMKDAINNCVIGCKRAHRVIRSILDRMIKRTVTDSPVFMGPGLLTEELMKLGVREPGVEVKIGDVMIYDRERFSPWFHGEPEIPRERLTERTFACHLYEGGWVKKAALA